MEIGGKHYLEESWDLDWENNYYCLAYEAFQYFKRINIKTDSFPYVDNKKALNLRTQYIALIYQINLKVYQAQKLILYFMYILINLFQNQAELMKELFAILL